VVEGSSPSFGASFLLFPIANKDPHFAEYTSISIPVGFVFTALLFFVLHMDSFCTSMTVWILMLFISLSAVCSYRESPAVLWRRITPHAIKRDSVTANKFQSLSFVDEIGHIFDKLLLQLRENNSLNLVDPSILFDSAHILTSGQAYEDAVQIMYKNAKQEKDLSNIEAVDSFLKGFILAERKKRVRLKVNYLLEGAKKGKLEHAISLLSERYKFLPTRTFPICFILWFIIPLISLLVNRSMMSY
jgi:hypothetical protein